ncbi:Protein kinase-like domain [Pseudocohnilembus persalinus]|uniref:Protein kinase-like domain n=1 Tax=Pseudocohnilembus persalinus TaxID=266149 RepID=A0A0V0QRC2_PSEPJ|nr:Protein kinase-like domain [Pseudocohnilembus persalinus]|eukprot:KRX04831.1 Protein kinase-like domain [Pseudocohnilembus persalinus]
MIKQDENIQVQNLNELLMKSEDYFKSETSQYKNQNQKQIQKTNNNQNKTYQDSIQDDNKNKLVDQNIPTEITQEENFKTEQSEGVCEFNKIQEQSNENVKQQNNQDNDKNQGKNLQKVKNNLNKPLNIGEVKSLTYIKNNQNNSNKNLLTTIGSEINNQQGDFQQVVKKMNKRKEQKSNQYNYSLDFRDNIILNESQTTQQYQANSVKNSESSQNRNIKNLFSNQQKQVNQIKIQKSHNASKMPSKGQVEIRQIYIENEQFQKQQQQEKIQSQEYVIQDQKNEKKDINLKKLYTKDLQNLQEFILQNQTQKSAFIYAVIKGNLEIVKILLQKSENLDINLQDTDGNSALHHASQNGYIKILEFLLFQNNNKVSINLNLKNKFDKTAQQLSCNKQTLDLFNQKVVENMQKQMLMNKYISNENQGSKYSQQDQNLVTKQNSKNYEQNIEVNKNSSLKQTQNSQFQYLSDSNQVKKIRYKKINNQNILNISNYDEFQQREGIQDQFQSANIKKSYQLDYETNTCKASAKNKIMKDVFFELQKSGNIQQQYRQNSPSNITESEFKQQHLNQNFYQNINSQNNNKSQSRSNKKYNSSQKSVNLNLNMTNNANINSNNNNLNEETFQNMSSYIINTQKDRERDNSLKKQFSSKNTFRFTQFVKTNNTNNNSNNISQINLTQNFQEKCNTQNKNSQNNNNISNLSQISIQNNQSNNNINDKSLTSQKCQNSYLNLQSQQQRQWANKLQDYSVSSYRDNYSNRSKKKSVNNIQINNNNNYSTLQQKINKQTNYNGHQTLQNEKKTEFQYLQDYQTDEQFYQKLKNIQDKQIYNDINIFKEQQSQKHNFDQEIKDENFFQSYSNKEKSQDILSSSQNSYDDDLYSKQNTSSNQSKFYNSDYNSNYNSNQNQQENSQTPRFQSKVQLKDFIVHSLLGKGSFGEVYLVEKKDNNKYYAMKVLHKSKIEKYNVTRYAQTERNVLSITDHPFIVKLEFAFQNLERLFLILSFAPGGDLGKMLAKEKQFSEQRAKIYAAEVLLALEDLHKRDIIFRDLKPDNVVLGSDGHILLTDFGLSKEGVLEQIQGAKSFCGSVAYLAPEMLQRQGHGKAVDWYLLGVLLHEMVVGLPPYYSLQREELFQNIKYAKLQLPDYLSKGIKSLLKKLLVKDPAERLGSGPQGAEQIKNHKFFWDINWEKLYNKKYHVPEPEQKQLILNQYVNTNFLDSYSFLTDSQAQFNNLRSHLQGWSFIADDNI